MANYIFEQMTDAQAAAYDPTTDALYFLTGNPSTVQVTVNPASGFSLASLTLTNSGVSHTFGADALANETLTFFGESSNDTLKFGADSVNDTVTVSGVVGAGARFFALGGNDTITGSVASDTIFGGEGADSIVGASSTNTEADYLNGGNGNDTITGGSGNDHIWGNEQNSTQGAADGNDVITTGDGKNYVNGNAGDDSITGGINNDALYGGAGNDTILGGAGNDHLQGNKGNDSLDGGANDDDIHGGANNDTLIGGTGNDVLSGDLGDDSVSGGAGFDTVWGGAGNDTFNFAAGESSNVNVGATGANANVTDVISDFTDGQDHIHLDFLPVAAAVLHDTTGTVATTAIGAQNLATQMLAGHTGTGEVAAVTVGTDTYLFYHGDGTSDVIDSVVKVLGVTDSAFTNADFS